MNETKKAHEQKWKWEDGHHPGIRQGLRRVFSEAKGTTPDDIALAVQAPAMARSLLQAHEDSRCTCRPGDAWRCHIAEVLTLARVLPPK